VEVLRPQRATWKRVASDAGHAVLDAAAAAGRASGLSRPRTRGIEDIDSILARHDEMRGEWAVLRGDYLALHEIVKARAPRRIVEIGVRRGYSAFAMLCAAPEAEYFGFDADLCTWGGVPGALWDARRMLRREFPRAKVTVRRVDTAAEGVRLPAADVYFVDGDHSEEGALRDLELCAAAVDHARNALLLVDDFIHEAGVRRAIERFEALHGFPAKLSPTHRGLAAFELPPRG
jgi:predicted O-methyltransferase YrrM